MQRFPGWFRLIFLTLLPACGGTSEQGSDRPSLATETGETAVMIPFTFERFEQDLFALTKETFASDTANLYRKYGDFFDLFTSKIVRVGNKKLPLFRENLLGFIQDPDIQSIYKATQEQYAGLTGISEQFRGAFNRYHTLFSDSLVPAVYTMVSGFNYNVAVSDSAVAVGLDMYLGANAQFYEWLALPKYKTANMHRGQIVSDALRAFALSTFEMDHATEDLVSWMVYHGKILYLVQELIPEEKEEAVLGYSPAQLAWCYENEGKIWAHFIDKKLFYSNDFEHKIAYINDGPFTKGFTDKAPARLGVWLGLQIVKSYMKKHPDLSVPELLRVKDTHQLFNQSGYKPGRV